jgi:nucleoside-diphosphate-sugar epimerase
LGQPNTFLTAVGDYTVSKAFGEALAYSYVQQHQMEIVCVRIGNYTGDRIESGDNAVIHPHQLSPGDCVRCFEAAITHPGVTYEVRSLSGNPKPRLHCASH